jgi:hypothetical protein
LGLRSWQAILGEIECPELVEGRIERIGFTGAIPKPWSQEVNW